MPLPEAPSRQTLDDTPPRILTFLMGVRMVPQITAALATKGYGQEDHDEAFNLLRELSVYPTPQAPQADRAVQSAIVELDRWDEPHFAAIGAVLSRRHPDQAAFVFQDLTAKQGAESVLAVETLLDRLDALENAHDRKNTRKADHAALQTLEKRGYTAAERERLRGLVKLAQEIAPTEPVAEDRRTAIVIKLHAWWTDWSATARTVITRRDHLIRLGLAKRKKGARGKTAAAPTSNAVPPHEPATPTP